MSAVLVEASPTEPSDLPVSRATSRRALRAVEPEERAAVEILDCLRKYGQRLDIEIAKETGVALETVRERLTALAATGAVITCSLTRFEKGKRLDALQCRVSGYVPPLAPGRKAAPKP
jgi:hypothetical protein